jgi:FtsH-binding integral membrane protein
VSATTPALIVAAAGVGFGHAILPDHWVPLGVLSRTNRYPLRRVARLAGLAGLAHVLVSLVIGAVIVIVGLGLRSTVEHVQNAIVGGLLIATGAGFALLEATGHGHSHGHDHPHGHTHGHGHDDASDHDHAQDHSHDHGHDHEDPASRRGAFMISFGAAASPDLTILPVFLAATAAGAGAAIASLVVFAAVTVTTIVALTLMATIGGYGLRSQWLERWGNAFTALILVVIGCLVLTGTI